MGRRCLTGRLTHLLIISSIFATNYSQILLQERSVVCSASSMDISLSFSKPFTGGIFTENGGYNDDSCRWKAQNKKNIVVKVPIFNATCGVKTNETSGEFSVKLIISPVDGLIVEGFTAINVRCIYNTQDITLTLPPGQNGNALQISGTQTDAGVITGSVDAPLLSMQILDGHGVDGPPLSKASVGQRITLDLVLKNTAIYDFYVHSCYAHDGTNTPDASINIIDSNGCAVRLSRAIDVPTLTREPVNHGPKHVYLHMYGFQFTSSQFVHFECQIKPCVYSCRRQQCESNTEENKVPLIPALRRRREEAERGNLTTLYLQTVLRIEPQQVQKAALVSSQQILEHCISLNHVAIISLLLFIVTVTTISLLFCLCSSKKRTLPPESVYGVSHVFPQ